MEPDGYRGSDPLPIGLGIGCGVALFLFLGTYWTALSGFAVAPKARWIAGLTVIALAAGLLGKGVSALIRKLKRRC